MLRVIGISFAAIAALGCIANAGDDFGTVRRDVIVSYGDLDLSADAGAHAMLMRITDAARKACGGTAYFSPMYSVAPELARKDFAACQTNAISTALKSLNAPLVTRISAQNGDQTLQIAGR